MTPPNSSVPAARLVVAAGAALVGVLLVASITASGGDGGGSAARRAAAATASPSTGPVAEPSPGLEPAPDREEQASFVRALNADETLVLAEEVRAAPVVEDSEPLVEQGTRVEVDWETFEQFAPGGAVVEAVASGPTTGRLVLALVREDEEWRLVSAERLP